MMQFLGGGLFEAMWNNFYNSLVRNVSPFTQGAIIVIGVVIALVSIMYSIKKGDEKKPIKNWFAFWTGIFIIVLMLVYTILCNL